MASLQAAVASVAPRMLLLLSLPRILAPVVVAAAALISQASKPLVPQAVTAWPQLAPQACRMFVVVAAAALQQLAQGLAAAPVTRALLPAALLCTDQAAALEFRLELRALVAQVPVMVVSPRLKQPLMLSLIAAAAAAAAATLWRRTLLTANQATAAPA